MWASIRTLTTPAQTPERKPSHHPFALAIGMARRTKTAREAIARRLFHAWVGMGPSGVSQLGKQASQALFEGLEMGIFHGRQIGRPVERRSEKRNAGADGVKPQSAASEQR